MNVAGLLVLARQRLDDEVTPGLWSDDELIGFLNEAVKQACIRQRFLFEANHPRVCTAPVTAGSAQVRLHSAVLAIRSARLASTSKPLDLVTLRWMDRERPEWPHDRGTPERIVVDQQNGRMTLHPTPTQDDTLQLAVWRTPLEAELMTEAGDEPVVDAFWHADLVDWVEHLAYLRADSETQDLARSNEAAARFAAKFGRMPSAHEIKCWGLSPPQRRRTAFD